PISLRAAAPVAMPSCMIACISSGGGGPALSGLVVVTMVRNFISSLLWHRRGEAISSTSRLIPQRRRIAERIDSRRGVWKMFPRFAPREAKRGILFCGSGVGRPPEIEEGGGGGVVAGVLGEEDANEAGGRIVGPAGAEAAVPAV